MLQFENLIEETIFILNEAGGSTCKKIMNHIIKNNPGDNPYIENISDILRRMAQEGKIEQIINRPGAGRYLRYKLSQGKK
jgi:linker histone H1 and H5 family